MSHSFPSTFADAQRKNFVTYTPPLPPTESIPIHLLESPSLLASSGTTGFRTWEAALHLGGFLCSPAGKPYVNGLSIVELGAGTGLLSTLCARQLGAHFVLATDGNREIVSDLEANVGLNGLSKGFVETQQLRWGHSLIGGALDPRAQERRHYDTVLGAVVVRGCWKASGRLIEPTFRAKQARLST